MKKISEDKNFIYFECLIGSSYELLRNDGQLMAEQSSLNIAENENEASEIDYIVIKKEAYVGLVIVRNTGYNKNAQFELVNKEWGLS